MPLLDASIAFALTMLALASLTSLLVEMTHRVLRLRFVGLKKMLGRVFDGLSAKNIAFAGLDRSSFVQKVLENPITGDASWQGPLRQPETLSTEQLLHRLGQIDEVKQLGQDTDGELRNLVTTVSGLFDEIGAAASDFFTRRAKLLSVLAGIGFAVFANVNALTVFETYTNNPQAVQAIMSQSGTFTGEWEATRALLNQSVADLQQDGQIAAAVDIQNQLNTLNTNIGSLGQIGLPIGGERPPLELSAARTWFVVLLTGFLLGLGGPFWYQIVTRLVRARRSVMSGGEVGNGAIAVAQAAGSEFQVEQRIRIFKGEV